MKLPAKTLSGKLLLVFGAGLLLWGLVVNVAGGDCGCEAKR